MCSREINNLNAYVQELKDLGFTDDLINVVLSAITISNFTNPKPFVKELIQEHTVYVAVKESGGLVEDVTVYINEDDANDDVKEFKEQNPDADTDGSKVWRGKVWQKQ